MSLKDVDIGAALRRLAERRIEDAMKEGKFDNLPGAGQPLVLDDAPADEDARMTWWALRILRNNDFTPHEVQWRKLVDKLKAELSATSDEIRVTSLCRQINELVRKLNTLGTNAINIAMTGVSLEDELARVRRRKP